MSGPLVIKAIKRLSKLNVFQDFTAGSALPPLRQHNLIYGFNGCGKTTLSRVLWSLGEGRLHDSLDPECLFQIELNNGTVIQNNSCLEILKGKVFVFNQDFIEANFAWNTARASPVFYIGDAQSDAAKRLDAARQTREAKQIDLRAIEAQVNACQQALSEFRRLTAQAVAKDLRIHGRAFEARQLDAAYADYEYNGNDILSEGECAELRTIIELPEPPARLERLELNLREIPELCQKIRELITRSFGQWVVGELEQHSSMLSWAKVGFDYHQNNELSRCLFCGHEVSADRHKMLAKLFDDQYQAFQHEISSVLDALARLRTGVATFKSRYRRELFSSKLREQFDTAITVYQCTAEGFEAALLDLEGALQAKKAEPNKPQSLANLPNIEELALVSTRLESNMDSINAIVDANNKIHDEFFETKLDASACLKRHHLATSWQAFEQHKAAVDIAKGQRASLVSEAVAIDSEIRKLQHEVRSHGRAAKKINELIQRHLRHNELQIEAVEDDDNPGFQLVRNGVVAKGTPSEGEKTAIVFSYFLVRLEAEGRKLSELIVVVDDPVSSLDTRALNLVSAMVRTSLKGAAQLVVLTHNLQFMNELKKWLKDRTESALAKKNKARDSASAALFLIETHRNADASRSSVIFEMPKHIREYESEYQYLFHLMLRFRESTDSERDYFYVMPNALRKILEVFLAFKEPAGEGLSNKLGRVANAHNFDETTRLALDRLVQVESHADNLDDLITLSSTTVEETAEAIDALLDFMKAVDPRHHERMLELCKP